MKLRILQGLCFVLLFGSGDFQRLRVTGNYSATEVIAGNDVSIPCWLSGVPTPLDLWKVSVHWTHKSHNASERVIYSFDGSHYDSSRSGAYINVSRLVQGDAALYLPRVQISDDGEYSCDVIVTPDDGKAMSTLHVSVTPQINWSYHQNIKLGFEGSVVCEASGFYPEDIKMEWARRSKRSNSLSYLHEDISFTRPVQNGDGTFNGSSLLTLRPSHGIDPGEELFCVVTHRSLEEPLISRFTVPSVNPWMTFFYTFLILNAVRFLTTSLKKYFTNRWRPWRNVLCIVLNISIIVLLIYLLQSLKDFLFGALTWIHIFIVVYIYPLFRHGVDFWQYYIKGVPTVSEISGTEHLQHNKPTTLTFQITDFRGKEIQINVFLKRKNGQMKQLFHSTDQTSSNDSNNLPVPATEGRSSHIGQNTDHSILPLELSGHRALLSERMKVTLTRSYIGLYTCHCFIPLTPNAGEDDGAVLTVKVEHSTLNWPIYQHRTLKVHTGDKPVYGIFCKRLGEFINSVSMRKKGIRIFSKV